MTRDQKTQAIEDLKVKFENKFFYVTDASTLTVQSVQKNEKGIEMQVVKNTLVVKRQLESF